jgi:DNA-nicking Smr family endonuclease
MSEPPRKSEPRRSHRPLDPQDAALWDHVTRSVRPLRPLPRVIASEPIMPEASPPVATVAPDPPKPRSLPPLAPMERRERQKLARGQAPIERRLDLHGFRQNEAHGRLLAALGQAQADGVRVLLVITGKGGGLARDGSERGVLRRLVPLWLSLPEFRAYVVGFDEAHVGHGGSGALYVRVRRRRESAP